MIKISSRFGPLKAELHVRNASGFTLFRYGFTQDELRDLSDACERAIRILDSIQDIDKKSFEGALEKANDEEDLTPDGRFMS